MGLMSVCCLWGYHDGEHTLPVGSMFHDALEYEKTRSAALLAALFVSKAQVDPGFRTPV